MGIYSVKVSGRRRQAWPKGGVATFGAIPKYWLWQWFADNSNMTVGFAESAEHVDRCSVRKIMEFVFACDGRTIIPKEVCEDIS
jgi:hypothetical protein